MNKRSPLTAIAQRNSQTIALVVLVAPSRRCELPSEKRLIRGLTELVQHFASRRSSHRRKGAARHIIDMVWLIAGLSHGGEGGGIVILPVQIVSTCLRGAYRKRGGQHPVWSSP